MGQQLVYINSSNTFLRYETLFHEHQQGSSGYFPVFSRAAHKALNRNDLTLVSALNKKHYKQTPGKSVLILCPVEDFSSSLHDLKNLEDKGFKLYILKDADTLRHNAPMDLFQVPFSTKEFLRYPEFLADEVNHFANKTILITGAGGSIGSALSQRLSLMGCKELILIDHSERLMFELSQQLKVFEEKQSIVYSVTDISDRTRIDQLFERHRPNQVFHLAAYKHVGLMEQNPYAAFKTNVLGTKYLFDTAVEHEVNQFSFISTDKAVEPVCVMGMTKKIAENYLLNSSTETTKAHILRFGNVLGSSGSVVLRFQKALTEHKPLEITHPDMSRYFVLINDLINFILKASNLAEQRDILLFHIKSSTSILSLAKTLIQLSAEGERVAPPIRFKNGNTYEKLNESLIAKHELVSDTNVPQIKRLTSSTSYLNIQEIIDELEHQLLGLKPNLSFEDFAALLRNKGLVPS